MAAPARVLGLMSGTSCDAIDGACLETDGESIKTFGAGRAWNWPQASRALVFAAARAMAEGHDDAPEIKQGDEVITQAHIKFVLDFIADEPEWRPELIGFHGQTIYHNPSQKRSCQLGSPALLAKAVGIPVVGDFRQHDIAEGGEGAPLAPIYHWALAQKFNLPRPLLVLNLGGVGNLTFIGKDEESLLAFDTGAGMAALDDWAVRHWQQVFDKGGQHALAGKADKALLARLLDDDFFSRPPPKSLDKTQFALASLCARLPKLETLAPNDGAALLAAFTAQSVAAGFKFLPARPLSMLVAGGGRHHQAVMEHLARLSDFPVQIADDAGWRGDLLEAECFAFLAARSKNGLPLTYPKTTGVCQPRGGGVLYSPA